MAASASADTVLEARGLVHAYGRRKVLDGIDLTVPAGTLVGVVGENGAGKSTLLKILAGELSPRAGWVAEVGRLGYCPQLPLLNDALTVRQHLDYFAAAYGLLDLDYALELVHLLGFQPWLKARVGVLSGGTRQKLNLTLALMHRPALLLLDEPYQGFDWETYLRFWQLVGRLRSEGTACVVISHLVFERDRFDHLYQLRDGKLHEEGDGG